jgi:hypothetical protein
MPDEYEAAAEGRLDWVWLIGLTLPHFYLQLIEINMGNTPTPGGGIGRTERRSAEINFFIEIAPNVRFWLNHAGLC